MTQLTWIAAFWPSLFYVLRSVCQGHEVTDRGLLDVLRSAAEPLRAWTLPDDFWWHMITAAAEDSVDGDGGGQAWSSRLAERVAATRIGDRLTDDPSTGRVPVDRIVQRFELAGAELRRQRPRLEIELPLRIRPLQEQWLARGPGLMRLIDRSIGVSRSTAGSIRAIALVPLTGGAGRAFPTESALTIEAVLTNSDDRIPELARLAWLVTRIRLPASCEPSPPLCTSPRQQLASILLALACCQQLDWFAQSQPPLALALHSWLGVPASLAEQTAAALPEDWAVQLASRRDLGLLWELADALAPALA